MLQIFSRTIFVEPLFLKAILKNETVKTTFLLLSHLSFCLPIALSKLQSCFSLAKDVFDSPIFSSGFRKKGFDEKRLAKRFEACMIWLSFRCRFKKIYRINRLLRNFAEINCDFPKIYWKTDVKILSKKGFYRQKYPHCY